MLIILFSNSLDAKLADTNNFFIVHFWKKKKHNLESCLYTILTLLYNCPTLLKITHLSQSEKNNALKST